MTNIAQQAIITNDFQTNVTHVEKELKGHKEAYEVLFYLDAKLKSYISDRMIKEGSDMTKKTINHTNTLKNVIGRRILESYGAINQDYITKYFNSFIHSGALIFKNLSPVYAQYARASNDIELQPLTHDEYELIMAITNNSILPNDVGFDTKILPKSASKLIPSFYGDKISTITFAAFCGNDKAFQMYFNDKDLTIDSIMTREMEYAALFGGNPYIITLLALNGMAFHDVEAAIKGFKTHVLKYLLCTKEFNIDASNPAFIKTAIECNNVRALLMLKPLSFLLDDKSSLLSSAAFILSLKKQFKAIPNKLTKNLDNVKHNKYYKEIEIMMNPNFDIRILERLFESDMKVIDETSLITPALKKNLNTSLINMKINIDAFIGNSLLA